jgi:ribosomal protein L12E/L44/L45/RPP1/RPP2
MTARYDGEIKRLEEAIARVEQEGKRIDEVLGGRGGVRPPRKPAAAAGKKAPGKAAASKKAAKPRAKKAGKG